MKLPTEPMFTTLAGSSGVAAFRRSGRSRFVSSNTAFTFRFRTLSKPEAGYSSMGAPHAAPALLTRMWSAASRADTSVAR